ncbi:alpha/beta fold hydrolase [Lacinutrix sp. 5H-3-7-4]|uniref:alpha/beta fold hydrolase n=1 Tax=Lacinutrix sp. (strain 5H-3-7-4) TaxID=983544 RepID=UPI00020A3BFE|nr:alpha/beta hydrolase [Lacinutrix sp. 5H-3-7-4]AEH01037.1 alpha/beta hydrolase fold protein [Lacinutrix sp. 5H-3-7-4]
MKLEYKGINVFYNDIGNGPTVVLLHGFLEDHSMWDSVLKPLSQNNRVITIDLLGHGQTESLGYIHTMEDMALCVNAVLKKLNLKQYTLIGHSMGGYVALAFASLYPNTIKGLCLLNSTFKSDSNERKLLRVRANKMAQTNFKNLIKMSFANLFSKESKELHIKKYNQALDVALKTSLQGYMAANEGMIQRKDFSRFFAEASFKKMILLGKKDAIIDVKLIIEYAEVKHIEYHVFSEGHMSHIENKEDFLTQLMFFIEKI